MVIVLRTATDMDNCGVLALPAPSIDTSSPPRFSTTESNIPGQDARELRAPEMSTRRRRADLGCLALSVRVHLQRTVDSSKWVIKVHLRTTVVNWPLKSRAW
ncbi:hypothetical protein MRX96_012187 [Rhipicephalus microplus]